MLEQLLNKLQQQKPASSAELPANQQDAPVMKKAVEADIDKLYTCSRKGSWALVIFFAASIVAFYCRDYTLTGCLSAAVREQLGAAPPDILIDILQLVSTFSSLIIITGGIYDGRMPGNTWAHLGFRLLFFPLYFIADSLRAHFDFVFVSGLVVLALHHYNIWMYASRAIEKKMTLSAQLSACERVSSGK